MHSRLLLAAILACLVGCAIGGGVPVPNPAPRHGVVVVGHKHLDMEVHLRTVYVSGSDECLINRPILGGAVVRTHRGTMRTFSTGTENFSAELFMDGYLPGGCQWRATGVEVSVNRPPYDASRATWVRFVAYDLLGTAALEKAVYACRPVNRNAKAMWCKGPVVAIVDFPAHLEISLEFDNDVSFW